jgi:uncharacterized protein YkwD
MRHAAGRRAIVLVLISSITLIAFSPTASARPSDRLASKLLGIVNATREEHHLRPLQLERSLGGPATRHSARMVRANRLFDPPNLEQILSGYAWNDIGADVVGCGATLREMHRIVMSEAFHRTILLDPDIRRVGIGVVVARDHNRCGRGSVWATEILYG